ncbi:hypothetical protein F5887DRAFT_920463 [Amanita rubescens]|nr:hypothetical protein F5887DRAFT_920463 [Amanita rubescens]
MSLSLIYQVLYTSFGRFCLTITITGRITPLQVTINCSKSKQWSYRKVQGTSCLMVAACQHQCGEDVERPEEFLCNMLDLKKLPWWIPIFGQILGRPRFGHIAEFRAITEATTALQTSQYSLAPDPIPLFVRHNNSEEFRGRSKTKDSVYAEYPCKKWPRTCHAKRWPTSPSASGLTVVSRETVERFKLLQGSGWSALNQVAKKFLNRGKKAGLSGKDGGQRGRGRKAARGGRNVAKRLPTRRRAKMMTKHKYTKVILVHFTGLWALPEAGSGFSDNLAWGKNGQKRRKSVRTKWSKIGHFGIRHIWALSGCYIRFKG